MGSSTSTPCSVTLGGRRIEYTVRVSLKAKRLRIGVTPADGLVVVTPCGFDLSLLPDLLKTKERWILRHLEEADQAKVRQAPPVLENGVQLPYRGGLLTLRVTLATRDVAVGQHDGSLRVRLSRLSGETLRPIVEAWYRAEAHRVITERVEALAARFGAAYGKVNIRNQKARWGSCSSRRNLNFNWRLIMAPPEIMDYILIHELTHLEQMNHSVQFWQLVAARCPDYRRCEVWLKKQGATLAF
jgi:predicted metal-dependent hydrolase